MKRKRLFDVLILSFAPLLSAASSNERPVRFLNLDFGPLERGKDYSVVSGLHCVLSDYEVTYSVSIYDRSAFESSKKLLWQFSEKRTTVAGEDMRYAYTIPGSLIGERVYLALAYSYYTYSSGSVFPGFNKVESYLNCGTYTPVGDEEVYFGSEDVIYLAERLEMRTGQSTHYYVPVLSMYEYPETLLTTYRTVPTNEFFRFAFINKKYIGAKHWIKGYDFSSLGPRLEIKGDHAEDFESFCDYLIRDYNGVTAGFYMKIYDLSDSGMYYYGLPTNTFVVNRYTGMMRRAASPNEDELSANIIFIPPCDEEATYSVDIFTTKVDRYYNIPRLRTHCDLYISARKMGSCLNAEYCIGASYE